MPHKPMCAYFEGAGECHCRALRNADDVTPLRAEVAWFAESMEIQLCANDHKTGWQQMTLRQLLARLKQETCELERAIINLGVHGDPRLVIGEAADVANFAMMIADNAAKADGE